MADLKCLIGFTPIDEVYPGITEEEIESMEILFDEDDDERMVLTTGVLLNKDMTEVLGIWVHKDVELNPREAISGHNGHEMTHPEATNEEMTGMVHQFMAEVGLVFQPNYRQWETIGVLNFGEEDE